MSDVTTPILQVQDLKVEFHTESGVVQAVNGVSFDLYPGETLGIVGESGSGKSVTNLTLMGLIPQPPGRVGGGQVLYDGRNILGLTQRQWQEIRGKKIAMIFQDPMTALNPFLTVEEQLIEVTMLHMGLNRKEASQHAIELLKKVGIPGAEKRIRDYPHQFSGGMRQRVMIAMAISCQPDILIADEPTTALDVTIQKQILDLIRELRDQRQMAVLFITHDLGVIAEIADEVLVMYRGKVVEQGDVLDIYENPQHPYTKGLLNCRPRLDTTFKRLPTVSDFMDSVIHQDGSASITEKEVGPDRIDYFENHGRGRLLSKPSELYGYGFDEDPSIYGREATCIDENAKPLLSVNNLKVHFPIRRGLLQRTVGFVKAVDGVSFNVYKGQTLGLVGESGCGKTTTGRAILQLIKPTMGIVKFDGVYVNSQSIHELRKKMQIIFQYPFGSMNPRMTIESMITEPMMIQGFGQSKQDRVDRAASLLEEVGMLPEHLKRYPHEFSGGQRQRICIARALAVEPEFIICDESVSALDVSVQAQVLNLLNDLQESRGLTYVFISHDLSVVKFMADMMAVMKEGHIVEYGPSEAIYRNPK